METRFIKGWNRTKITDNLFCWDCPYCGLKVNTHYEDLEHGCKLPEYGLGHLANSALKLIGITKPRVNRFLRLITRDKRIKCDCDFRMRILNTIGRRLGLNYWLTSWKRGISPRQFQAAREAAREAARVACPPQKINACGKPPTPPPAAARLHNPA